MELNEKTEKRIATNTKKAYGSDVTAARATSTRIRVIPNLKTGSKSLFLKLKTCACKTILKAAKNYYQ